MAGRRRRAWGVWASRAASQQRAPALRRRLLVQQGLDAGGQLAEGLLEVLDVHLEHVPVWVRPSLEPLEGIQSANQRCVLCLRAVCAQHGSTITATRRTICRRCLALRNAAIGEYVPTEPMSAA